MSYSPYPFKERKWTEDRKGDWRESMKGKEKREMNRRSWEARRGDRMGEIGREWEGKQEKKREWEWEGNDYERKGKGRRREGSGKGARMEKKRRNV